MRWKTRKKKKKKAFGRQKECITTLGQGKLVADRGLCYEKTQIGTTSTRNTTMMIPRLLLIFRYVTSIHAEKLCQIRYEKIFF